MTPISVLVIGGTGKISSACVRRAVERGDEVTVMNRGHSSIRPLPPEAQVIQADARDLDSVRAAVTGRTWDVVVDFVAFTTDDVRADIELYRARVGHYVFISSASAYQKPVRRLPITESTPLANPFWQYSRDKIACEELLVHAYREQGFPITIVRPSHTYDHTAVPLEGGWTVVERMRRGQPVVVHGDGTSLWVMTHADDFARAFIPLLANPQAIGDAFHITSDEVLTWNQIHEMLATAAGVEAKLVHVASDTLQRVLPRWGPSLLGDKSHSVVFDNSKVRQLAPGWRAGVPFARGAREIVAWHDAESSRRRIDDEVDAAFDALVAEAKNTNPPVPRRAEN